MKKIETEVKLIIEKPPISLVKSMDGYTESEILQIYLKSNELTHRVRRREYLGGEVEYTENTKRRISTLSSVETEREITVDEFNLLKENIEPGTHPIQKTRRTFSYHGHTIELDYYEEWKRTCIMEIELDAESEKFEYPEWIKIIIDATGKREYSNHSMARAFPKELPIA